MLKYYSINDYSFEQFCRLIDEFDEFIYVVNDRNVKIACLVQIRKLITCCHLIMCAGSPFAREIYMKQMRRHEICLK
jgi:hypothetical protein